MPDCLFCRIIAGEIPGKFLHQDEEMVAISDINPQAPLHGLIIPRRHVATLNDLGSDDDGLLGRMIRTATTLAKAHGYAEGGYRTVFNCNRGAGQTVYHIHLHVLAGRPFTWPPG